MSEVFCEGLQKLHDHKSLEDFSKIEGNLPNNYANGEENLLGQCVTIYQFKVDVHQCLTREEAEKSHKKHMHGHLLRILPHSVTVHRKVFKDGAEAVDPCPGKGDHDGEKNSRYCWDGEDRQLMCRA